MERLELFTIKKNHRPSEYWEMQRKCFQMMTSIKIFEIKLIFTCIATFEPVGCWLFWEVGGFQFLFLLWHFLELELFAEVTSRRVLWDVFGCLQLICCKKRGTYFWNQWVLFLSRISWCWVFYNIPSSPLFFKSIGSTIIKWIKQIFHWEKGGRSLEGEVVRLWGWSIVLRSSPCDDDVLVVVVESGARVQHLLRDVSEQTDTKHKVLSYLTHLTPHTQAPCYSLYISQFTLWLYLI